LQHAHNPVDWYAWGPEAFEKARRRSSIFLSIGYRHATGATSLGRESFENEETAAILNKYFIAIKVDREERPDVDRIYILRPGNHGRRRMAHVGVVDAGAEAVRGRHLLSAGESVRPRRFSLMLERIARPQRRSRENRGIEPCGSQAVTARRQVTPSGGLDASALEAATCNSGAASIRSSAGSSAAPKFPRPVALNFLLRYSAHAPGYAT
jgi:uncharacterized protein YyaL (SSP411 family)